MDEKLVKTAAFVSMAIKEFEPRLIGVVLVAVWQDDGGVRSGMAFNAEEPEDENLVLECSLSVLQDVTRHQQEPLKNEELN